MRGIGLANDHALHIAPTKSLKKRHGVIAGIGRNAPLRQPPEFFHLRPVLGVGNGAARWQQVRERPGIAHTAAGVGLACERKRRCAGAANLPGQQMQVVDEVVGKNPLYTLVDAHAPQAHGGGRFGKGSGRHINLLYRNTADFGSLEGKKVYYRNKHLLNWKENLALDTFAEAAVMDIVDHYQPDVLFLHQATLDHERHINGTQGDAILEAHQKHGHWLANIFDMYKRAGIFDKTTFVILGDHGQLNIRRVVSINEMLRREGLIKTDGLGNIIDYDAYVQSAGISGHVYIKNKLAAAKVISILEEAKRLGYIEHIFNRDQLNSMHLSGDFDYVVESCPFISISNDVDGEIVNEINNDDYKYAKATHGHLPTKGDRPPFIIYNSQLPARVIEQGRLVDEFPTFMKLLGFVIPDDIDGTALI